MKNKVLVMLLAAFVGGINANDDAGQLAVALAQTGVQLYAADQKNQQSLPNESNFRKRLYWLFEHNPLFYKLDGFQKDFDYYIAVLIEHIKALEGKIALKQNGLKSKGMRAGVVISALSALSGYGAYFCYAARKAIKADAALYGASISARLSQDAMNNAVVFGVASALLAAAAGSQFYKVSRYAERIVERLERDKRILTVLEQEKAGKDAKEAQKISNSPAEEAIAKLMNAIVSAINSVVQPVAVPTAVESSNNTAESAVTA